MGLSLGGLGRSIRDIFDANTADDYARRQQQYGRRISYEDEQRQVYGRQRPLTNIGQQVLGSTARLINTGKAGVGGVYGLGKLGVSSIFGTDAGYANTLKGVLESQRRDYSPNAGLFGAGTAFSNAQDPLLTGKGSVGEFTKRIGGTGLGVASEVGPLKAGNLFRAAPWAAKIGGRFGVGALEAALGNVGEQYVLEGRVRPEEVAGAAAFGGTLANVPGAFRFARSKLKSPDASMASPTAPKPTAKLRITEKLSPDRFIREKITQPIEEGVNKAVYKASVSKNPIVRGTARLAQGISREMGAPADLKTARRELLKGTSEAGKVKGMDIAKMSDDLTPEARSRVWASLDVEQAGKQGKKVDTGSLSPQETAYRGAIVQSVEETTKGNLERGLITPEQANNPNYLTRAYEPFEGASNKSVEQSTKQGIMKQYKGRKDVTGDLIEQAIDDPAYLAGKKTAQSHQAWAINDYANFLDSNNYTYSKGGKGLVQLPNTKLYGSAAGKWVAKNVADDFTGFTYANGVLNAFNDIITAYDKLGIRQFKKQLLTVFNPAVRAGNQVSNRMFAILNGLNPVEFEINFRRTNGMINSRNPLYMEAVKRGLTGSDITRADFAKQLSQYIDDPDILKEAGNWFQRTYSRADDRARLAAFKSHVDKGLSLDEAAKQTQRGFQDYSSVGFFYDMAAKMPIVGNAFVRFAGDATRIGKNALVDHPLRTASLVGAYGVFNEVMSKVSGETAEDKDTREDRFGAPKIPFTDISLTTQTPWGEINVARFMPFYHFNEVQNPIARFAPIQESPIEVKDGKPKLRGAGLNDPLLGQVAQLLLDEDFRGKSIQDPENTGQFAEDLPQKDKTANIGRFLATQNIPLGREADTIASAAMGKEDIYGKKRNVPQAIARAAGIKVEQFGPEQARKTRERNTFFEEKEKIDAEVAKLPQSQQETYKKLTGYYKLRGKTANEFEPGQERYIKAPVFDFPEDKWKEYTSNANVYDLMLKKKQDEFKRDGKPIQPEFDSRLSTSFRKQLVNNKSLAPGEDVEADERMYSNPEWDKYLKIKDEYKKAASKYYPKSDDDFVDELVKHKQADFPTKPAAKVAYDEAYARYVAGKGPKPQFTDAVKAARDQYSEAKRNWTNTEREARGLPPIARKEWENKTFGFDSDEGGLGFRFARSKGTRSAGSAYKYAVSLSAGGSAPRPKVSVKGGAPKSVQKRITKPKVTLKKSKV